MKRTLLAATALAALAHPALALDTPTPIDPAEPQMRQVEYRPTGRTLVINNPGRATILTFAPEEHVKRVVMGDGVTWSSPTAAAVEKAPLTNILPIWAEKPGRTTVQVVTTRADGTPDRVYQFAAVVRGIPSTCGAKQNEECADDPEATYGLTFLYPADEAAKQEAQRKAAAAARETERAARATRWREIQAVREQRALKDRLETDFACSNENYDGQGDAALKPDRTCDDGQWTGFAFDGNRPLPSIFIVVTDAETGKKSEQSVNAIERTTSTPCAVAASCKPIRRWLLVPSIRAEYRLRIGTTSVLAVLNRNPDPRGRNPGTGTSSPDVLREIVQR